MNRYLALQKIIELGSFTKAAEALGYTQSSISQMIGSLENELGIKLLTRSRTGIRLTIEGAELYPFVERSIIQYRAMQEKANEIKGLEPSIKYTFHDDYAIMTMVEAGLGVSILAELVLRRANYNIVCLPITPPVYRTLAIAYLMENKGRLP